MLHTKGSHFEYARRYPPEFARFGSSGGSRQQNVVDEYDNTVLYTDWLLSELIATLTQRGGASAVFFASDHGENLLDDERQLLGHGIGNRCCRIVGSLVGDSAVQRPSSTGSLRALALYLQPSKTAHRVGSATHQHRPHDPRSLVGYRGQRILPADATPQLLDRHGGSRSPTPSAPWDNCCLLLRLTLPRLGLAVFSLAAASSAKLQHEQPQTPVSAARHPPRLSS